MKRYALMRVLYGIATIIGVSIIIFIMARLSGDVTLLLLADHATDKEIAALKTKLGLDKPLPVQYGYFLKGAIRGDFGNSIRYRQSAVRLVLDRMPATIELASAAFLFSFIAGLILGVTSATKRRSIFDRLANIFGLLGQAMPGFWIGIMAILIFSVKLRLLPSSGRAGIENLVLPALTLGWFSTASIMRLTRSSMLDVLDSEYIKMARLKGNSERFVVWKHALRNALIPIITLSGVQLAQLIGGAVIIETVFAWPGIGSLIVEAVYGRDYTLVQAGVFIVSVGFVLINLIVDLLYGVIDPRIRYD